MSRVNSLEKYITKFAKLRVDKNPNRYTLGKAPHKPLSWAAKPPSSPEDGTNPVHNHPTYPLRTAKKPHF